MNVVVEPHAEGATFAVRAQPGGRKNAIRGVHDGAIKVSVTAAPENGKANAAIAELLCKTLGLRRGQLAILSGETDRRKRFLVRGVTVDGLRELLESVATGE